MSNLLKTILASAILLSAVAQGDLDSRQWSIHNRGQSYKRKIDDYQHVLVNGIKGVDLNLYKNLSTLEKDSSETIVAIIDSGVDIEHPELKDSIWESPDCAGKTQDQRKTENLICHGVNVLKNTNELYDKLGHGTFAAGEIVALKDKVGMSGVTHKKIKIMPIKTLDDKFYGFSSDGKLTSELIANGVVYATKNKARVINLSLGLPNIVVTPKVKAAFDFAIDNGVVIVVAAGNNNKNKPVFPCNYPRIICVGAIDATGNKINSSNFGHKVDLYAPGESIISTIPVGMESEILREANYDIKTGTSYAAPYVSALAALIISKNPSLTSNEVKNIILRSTRKMNGLNIVDFSAALDQKETRNIVFDVKALDEISVGSNEVFDIEFSMDSKQEITQKDISFAYDKKVMELKNLKLFNDDGRYKVLVRFSLLDDMAHSSQKIDIVINNGKISEISSIEIELNTLARDIDKKLISSIPAKAIMTVNKYVKRSSLQRVLQRDPNKKTQDLFFSESITEKIYLLKEEDDSFKPMILELENKSAISAVMKVDINFDSVDDYFIYGATADKKHYFLAFFNGVDGSAMFPKNYWMLKASRFGGLSFNKGFENFSYMRINTVFGQVKLPVFQREWLLSSEDNSNDPISRLENTLSKRVYYFEPRIVDEQVELAIRTINSYDNVEKIRKDLGLEDFHHLDMNEVLLQDIKQLNKGIVNVVASFGVGNKRKSALLEFSSVDTFLLKNISSVNSENNDFMRIRTTKELYSSEISFSKVFSRSLIRFGNFLSEKFNFTTGDWSDVLISTIDIFDIGNQVKTYFLESRYNIFAVKINKDGTQLIQKLPVDRESGYPGLAFSQSFQSTILASGEVGVFTDTKSIYGNTVGVLKLIGEEFKKPINSTYLIPEHCVSLGHTETEGKGFLQLHCTDQLKSWISKIEL